MAGIADLSDVVFNCGLETDATLIIGSVSKSAKVIWLNEYQKNQLLGMEFMGSEPLALIKSSLVEDVTVNVDTLKITGKNNNRAMKIKEVKEQGNGSTILILKYD